MRARLRNRLCPSWALQYREGAGGGMFTSSGTERYLTMPGNFRQAMGALFSTWYGVSIGLLFASQNARNHYPCESGLVSKGKAMGRIVLVTGGSRSGKSRFAQDYAEAAAPHRLFIATCPVIDAEMDARIERHRRDRAGRGWHTVEEQLHPDEAVRRHPDAGVILIDCLTLWVNNRMFHETAGAPMTEDGMGRAAQGLAEACRSHPGVTVLVTNEIGLGIIPDNPLSRRYRDLVGRCNQVIAAAADAVVLAVCGCPLVVKGTL